MPVSDYIGETNIADSVPVQIKKIDGNSSNISFRFYHCLVDRPDKMVAPRHCARIEQRNLCLSDLIEDGLNVGLSAIAMETGQSKIAWFAAAAF